MEDKQKLRQHVVMSVFSMTYESNFSVELTAYVVGIKEETVVKILQTCKDEYNGYVLGFYKKYKL